MQNMFYYISDVCNLGTREVNNEICEVCPVGTYQPLPGQQTCMNCPAEMKTMESGAYSSYQCKLLNVMSVQWNPF